MNLPLLLLALALADGTPTATTEQEEATRRCEVLRTGAHDPFAVRHLLALERLRDWVSPKTVEKCLDELASASNLPDHTKHAVAALRATQA